MNRKWVTVPDLIAAGVLLAAGVVCANELHMDAAGRDLALSVAVDGSRWVAGETVTITATLKNAGTQPLRVDTFGDLQAVYEGKHKSTTLISCWTLTWQPQVVFAAPHGGKAELASEQFVLLKPGQGYATPLGVKLEGVAPGRYQVRLSYSPRVASPSFNFPEYWLDQQKIREPIWSGMITSEAFAVEVVAAQ